MGNSNTKESRHDGDAVHSYSSPGDPSVREHLRETNSRTTRRMSRAEINLFGIGAGSSRTRDQPDAPFERRETKQEREARRLERERVQRAKDRERSMREEHVDGGYLVTLGTYTGTEDFSKPVVRQLQIERKLAPFWRGLNDWSSSWAEHQLIAAARGLDIPPADATPDPELVPRPLPPSENPSASSQNLQNLTVPMGPRTLSAASDRSGSGTGSALPSPSIPGQKSSTAFKPRAKALAAALTGGSRNASSTDLTPKETSLPQDPFVNGQPMEVFLYKDADECPICFLTYPPYLNHTRCCDQPICSECFVQIKRTDPHLPEHHPNGEARDPNEGLNPDDPPEMLISEPSACPYCQQPEFGVTYEPPPFRRGLAYSSMSGNPTHSTAMSSQTSINSTLQTPPTGRRRGHSLSANAPNVITTDRVRPDWAAKLASARNHQARRAAAATALHTAAFLMGGNEQRSILRPGRFGRRNPGNNDSNASPSASGQIQVQDEGQNDEGEGPEPGARGSSRNATGRRSRMDELEEMMFMEAVRLSLASEEERKRKEDKAIRKETKRREKEERKAAKKGGNPYGGSGSGASASSLSLGMGRRRGNSTASNLRVEATVSRASQASSAPESPAEPKPKDDYLAGKGKGVDRGPPDVQGEPASSSSSLPLPSGPSRGASHLRQMSNASSVGSSINDSPLGTYSGPDYLGADEGPRSSGLSLGGYSDDGERDTGSAGVEPMFNFSSLAQMVGANLEDGSMRRDDEGESPDGTTYARPLSQVKEDDKEDAEAEHVEGTTAVKTEVVPSSLGAPVVMITPETPAPADDKEHDDKQLGYYTTTMAQ
ncbi:hypothetical protein FSARC_10234 [Fusarium sarcochroum]|uniref:Protein SIP5 n=1 Tax=Fusarium sarcochroum TaxID=1208366 RepID=A0A8H4TNN3_9HYPO|nr:hypothetical protein FSARC_10234 [Fusarium sarcochroum]